MRYNSFSITLGLLRSTYILGQVMPEYAPQYNEELYAEHRLFKLGCFGDNAEANAEAEAY